MKNAKSFALAAMAGAVTSVELLISTRVRGRKTGSHFSSNPLGATH